MDKNKFINIMDAIEKEVKSEFKWSNFLDGFNSRKELKKLSKKYKSYKVESQFILDSCIDLKCLGLDRNIIKVMKNHLNLNCIKEEKDLLRFRLEWLDYILDREFYLKNKNVG